MSTLELPSGELDYGAEILSSFVDLRRLRLDWGEGEDLEAVTADHQEIIESLRGSDGRVGKEVDPIVLQRLGALNIAEVRTTEFLRSQRELVEKCSAIVGANIKRFVMVEADNPNSIVRVNDEVKSRSATGIVTGLYPIVGEMLLVAPKRILKPRDYYRVIVFGADDHNDEPQVRITDLGLKKPRSH